MTGNKTDKEKEQEEVEKIQDEIDKHQEKIGAANRELERQREIIKNNGNAKDARDYSIIGCDTTFEDLCNEFIEPIKDNKLKKETRVKLKQIYNIGRKKGTTEIEIRQINQIQTETTGIVNVLENQIKGERVKIKELRGKLDIGLKK